MKKLINEIMFGKNSMVSAIIALSVIAAIGLGCFCNKDKFDLSNIGTNNSNISTTPSTSTPAATPDRTYTKADASKGEMPSNPELQDMTKTTLLDFNSAVQSADFTSFHGKICKPWKSQITAEKLKESFQAFIDKDIDIGNISSSTAEFSPAPEIGRELGYKTLKLRGRYPTSPQYTKFELNYIPEGKEWKLSKIVVDTTERNF
jgi:hypothetical protein